MFSNMLMDLFPHAWAVCEVVFAQLIHNKYFIIDIRNQYSLFPREVLFLTLWPFILQLNL